MKQNIINARVTFRKSPIHVLEKFAFKDMPNACLTFKKNSSVSECVIIQTCNRIELFATSDNHSVDEIKNTWASLTGLEDNAFRDTLEVCENRDAYEHLLKLTSGLESLVVGEEQILGQIKESISAARKIDASGKRLNKLFERSIRIWTPSLWISCAAALSLLLNNGVQEAKRGLIRAVSSSSIKCVG